MQEVQLGIFESSRAIEPLKAEAVVRKTNLVWYLLTLTLAETIMSNLFDFIHASMHVGHKVHRIPPQVWFYLLWLSKGHRVKITELDMVLRVAAQCKSGDL